MILDSGRVLSAHAEQHHDVRASAAPQLISTLGALLHFPQRLSATQVGRG